MANQAAIKLHTQPGDQLICDKWAHVYNYEGGGVSFNSGVSCKLIDGTRGMITAQQVEENINPPDFYHSPLTTLVCLENTTNKGGGACYDFEKLKKLSRYVTNTISVYTWMAPVYSMRLSRKGKLQNSMATCLILFRFVCPKGWEHHSVLS